MLRPKIGLDWDDVTAPFNSIAIAMANEKYHMIRHFGLRRLIPGKTVDVQVLSGNFTRTKNSMHASRFRRKTKKLCTV